MLRQNLVSGAVHSLTLAVMASVLACTPKSRPWADSEAIAANEGSDSDQRIAPTEETVSSETDELGSSGSEEGPPVSLDAVDSTESPSGQTTDTRDGGAAPVACVPSGPRDCTSELDNDCDGRADNILDAVCRCAPGALEGCDEHPGFDGLGLCKSGTRICIVRADSSNGASDWGACQDAVGPGAEDSCVRGDDTNCNGIPNEGCTCVEGETQPCGSTTDIGICAFGTSTCVNEAFGECTGAVPPAPRDSCFRGDDSNCNGVPNDGCTCIDGDTRPCGPQAVGICRSGVQTCANGIFGQCVGAVAAAGRNCNSPADNDCDGRADNIIDTVCQCVIGATRACGTHPQDGIGSCRAGSQQCVAGPNGSSSTFNQACTGSIGPAPRNCASALDNDCDGEPDNTIDNVCECVPGEGNGSCSDDPNNARCNGQGQCVPCQTDGDCSLVSGGRTRCDGGECVGPETFDCSGTLPPTGPEPTVTTGGLNPPAQTGGVILNGRYTITSVTFYGSLALRLPGEVIDFRDGFYRRNVTLYDPTSELVIGGFTEAGTYETSGPLLSIEGSTCSLGNTARSEVWEFTANGSQLTISSVVPGTVAYQSYQRTEIPD